MDTAILYFEIFGLVLFIAVLLDDLIRKRGQWDFLLGCAIFGLYLEIVGVHVYRAYLYSPDFRIQVSGVPLIISLSWGAIIYSSKQIADTIRFRRPVYRYLLIALLTILIDLSMDIVAIRINLWNWPIPLDHQWFGVPYENLLGWFFIPFAFSFLYDLFKRKWKGKWVALVPVPLVSLALLQVFFLLVFFGQNLFYLVFNPGLARNIEFPINRLVINSDPGVMFKSLLFFFLFMTALFLVARNVSGGPKGAKPWDRLKPIAVPVIYLFAFHLQFLVCLFLFRFYEQSPYFVVVSVLAIACEYLLVDRMALRRE